MNTSAQHPEPKGLPQPSDDRFQGEATVSAWRAPPACFGLVEVLVGLGLLLLEAPAAHADQSPPGCAGSGLKISFSDILSDVHIGDTINQTVKVFNEPFPSCDAGETNPAAAGAIQAYVVTPDGVTHNLALRRTFLAPGDSDSYTNVFSYVVRAQDIHPDGTVSITAFVQGNIHQYAFIPGAGVFNGLFCDANDVQTSSAGGFSLTMTATSTYKATIQYKGKGYPVRGKFDSNGQASNTLRRSGASPLTVNWQVNLSEPDYLYGTVSDGTNVAQLTGGRDVFNAGNPAPQAGRYTLVIPGIEDATDSPAGNGYGTAIVDAGGVVHFKGRLADDTVVVQNAALSKNGEWPVYISLYQRKGILVGWLQFADDGTNDLSGTLRWTKPNLPSSKLYKPGFSVNGEVIGSRYVVPIGTARMLPNTEGMVVLSGGNLPNSSIPVTFGSRSELVNSGPNALKLAFTPASGFFSGTFAEAGRTTIFPIKGAVLRRQNYGSGYFLGAGQSGKVTVRTAP
jgi:hypothetical protein